MTAKTLSARELATVRAFAERGSRKAAAEALRLDEYAVARFTKKAYRKLGVTNIEAAAFALGLDMAPRPPKEPKLMTGDGPPLTWEQTPGVCQDCPRLQAVGQPGKRRYRCGVFCTDRLRFGCPPPSEFPARCVAREQAEANDEWKRLP